MPIPSLGSQLDSARAKLDRASKQIDALKQSFDEFGQQDIYENDAEPYDPGFAYLDSRTEKVPPRPTVSPGGVHYQIPGYEITWFKSIALRIYATPKFDFAPH